MNRYAEAIALLKSAMDQIEKAYGPIAASNEGKIYEALREIELDLDSVMFDLMKNAKRK